MEELIDIIKTMQEQIENLQRQLDASVIIIPTEGKIVVDRRASDPTGENGRLYYNTTTHKLKVYENGVWKTITTT